MQYSLETLEKMVSDLIEIIHSPSLIRNGPGGNGLLLNLITESEHLKQSLTREVFQLSKAKEIELLVQNYQSALTHFLDRIYEKHAAVLHISGETLELIDGSYECILGLLSYIEERFSKCFDKKEKVPDVYLVLSAREMEDTWKKLLADPKWKEEDRIVLNRVVQGFRRFIELGMKRTITYEEVIYRKTLLKSLEELDEDESVESAMAYFSPLVQALIYMNYNDKEFIQFMLNRIMDKLDQSEDLRDQMAEILQSSKMLNQLILKPEVALLSRHPSLQFQLHQWLTEELYFIERRLSMFAISGSHTTSTEKKAILECRVPVDQLGIFFRAATDTKILFTASQKKLFEQIVPFLSTPNRSTLSPDSMRSKSYSPERKDIEGVKALLMTMYRQVSSY